MRLTSLISLLFLMTTMLTAQETVVLLHGLARTANSMHRMAEALEAEGYRVVNLDYNSRHHEIETLAKDLRARIRSETKSAGRVHFITHSLGGILVRQIQATDPLPNLGRVVMLAPPNQGSEVVDRIGHWKLFKWINGPAGNQLGTSKHSLVQQLPPIDFDCGVITGDRSINWINSCMIPGADDGKVSVKSAKVEGLTEFKVHHATHPFIMKKKRVIEDTIRFLKTGRF